MILTGVGALSGHSIVVLLLVVVLWSHQRIILIIAIVVVAMMSVDGTRMSSYSVADYIVLW